MRQCVYCLSKATKVLAAMREGGTWRKGCGSGAMMGGNSLVAIWGLLMTRHLGVWRYKYFFFFLNLFQAKSGKSRPSLLKMTGWMFYCFTRSFFHSVLLCHSCFSCWTTIKHTRHPPLYNCHGFTFNMCCHICLVMSYCSLKPLWV